MIIKPKKKFKILIIIVVVRRDYSTYGLLKSCLEGLGCKVLIVSSNNYSLALKFWKPDAVVVHTLKSGETALKIVPHIKLFFLDAEGFKPEDKCHAVIFSKQKKIIQKFSKFLFWGNQILKEFKKIAPELDVPNIRIVGNPKFDLARYFRNENIKSNDIKTIGVLTRFHMLNNHFGRPVTFFLLDNPEKHKHVDTQIKSFLILINTLKDILKNTDFKISIRVHPFESVDGYKNNVKRWFGEENLSRFEIDESLDFSYWASKQKVVISPTSNAITECYLLGIPVINIDKIAGVAKFNKKIDKVVEDWFQGVYLPSTSSDLIKLLKSEKLVVKKSKVIDNMLENYCNWHNRDYSARISSNEIISELNNNMKINFRFFLPLKVVNFLLSLKDRFDIFKNPLIKNYNYSSIIHKSPKIYSKITEKILKINS